ncbi:hypothetical protein J2Z66_001744 [Paenibacillus eucommiae]|uniref:Uncharacterized protein n=1 Tax=Paenibacillus eucommiae TaxID=1355755 RepID=A0ABS4ITD7_9BACL|nr:hypothetical protein [Paenibacillus eucommiae]
MLLTMKNIVKVAGPSQLYPHLSPSGWSPHPFPPSMHPSHEHAHQGTPQHVYFIINSAVSKRFLWYKDSIP